MNDQACYSINRDKGYVTIYNTKTRYPLKLWNEYRLMHDMTHQQVANALTNMHNDIKETTE